MSAAVTKYDDMADAMAHAGIEFSHHFAGDCYIKAFHIKAGSSLGKHVHTYDHFSLLVEGTADVLVDGEPERHEGYRLLTIRANHVHEVRAVTDIVWLCMHATGAVQ